MRNLLDLMAISFITITFCNTVQQKIYYNIHTFFRGMMASTIALLVKMGNTLEEGVTY